MSTNLITRIVVAAIFGPLIIAIGYLGGDWLFGMVLLFAVLGIGEFLINCKIGLKTPLFWLTLMLTAGIAALSMQASFTSALISFTSSFIILSILSILSKDRPINIFHRQSALVWGITYIGLLYPFVFHIQQLRPHKGGDWLLLLFGTIWLSDTIAMWVGKSLGIRKLAPHISPSKTMEGFVGGLFGGVIVAVIMGFWRLSDVIMILLILTGVVISLVGQIGDLVESVWKRSLGIKDSSGIIPGHGGILDRFDSLLFASPVLYIILKYFIYG